MSAGQNNSSSSFIVDKGFDIHKEKPAYSTALSSSKLSFHESGEMKITMAILVPDHLVKYIIGHDGVSIKDIMNKTGASISFSKDFQNDHKVTIHSKILGRACNITGTLSQNLNAISRIYEMVISLENKPMNDNSYSHSKQHMKDN